jgi:hypothetical protein
LASNANYSYSSVSSRLGKEATVSELIDMEKGCWNTSIINEIFTKEEAKVIVNIPLSLRFPSNCLIWIGSASGIFTVKSAYHLGMELKDRERGQCSTAVIDPGVWKAIWDMKVPNCVKLFIWRAYQNILPKRVNLFQRKVVDDCSCPCCGTEEETIIHAVWSCPVAQDVWGGKLSFSKM